MSADSKWESRQPRMEALEDRLLLSGNLLASQLGDALDLAETTIEWRSEAPPGFTYVEVTGEGAGVSKVISGVPEYFWTHGCSPTSVAMVFGYWDGVAYPDFFPGDASTQTAAVTDRIASAGHIADYAPTPDRVPPPAYHADDSIADFLLTSRDPSRHGSTAPANIPPGMEDYASWVGYTASNAWADNWSSFTWAEFTNEIDNDRPMVFGVDTDGNGETDHSVPVFGYRTDPGNQFACYTTWSENPGVHWFDWQGMSAGDPWGIYQGRYFRPVSGSPDLAGTYTNVTPEPLVWGNSFTYHYGVENFGSANAGGSYLKFYLSSDATIANTDYYLDAQYISPLNAYTSTSGSVSLSLPATPPAGFTEIDDVWIGVIVDANGDVAEGEEGNNRNLGLAKDSDAVHINGKPDLVGTNFELDLGILNLGDVQASFTVRNAGQSAAGGFYVGFYLSENSYISTSDVYLTRRYVSSLAAGANYNGTITLSPDTGDPFAGDGTYTIGMYIDYSGLVAEADEGNNRNEGPGLDQAPASYGKKIFLSDFEHGDGAMQIINDTAWAPEDGLWHSTTRRGAEAGHSGTHSMYYGRYDKLGGDWDYDIGDSAGVFYTKRIELPDEPVALTINYWSEVEASTSYDLILVQVYDPETGIYHRVLEKGSGLVGDTGGAWVQAVADLTQYAGRNIRLRVVFDTEGANNNNLEGWYVDDITLWAATNPTALEAYRSLNYNSDYYHQSSRVSWAGDHDTFVFNEEQLDGSFTITTDKMGSVVNPAMAVYDHATGEMLYMDSDSGTHDEAAVVLPNSGRWNSYLVEVWDAEEDSVGDLNVHIDGSGFSTLTTLSLDDGGDASHSGLINVDTDTDYYRLVAPPQASGTLDITLVETSGTLRTRLQVWKLDGDDKPEVILSSDENPEQAHLTGVSPGDIFYVAVADNDFTGTGNFELTVNFSTSVPGTMTTAEGFAYFHRDGNSNDAANFNAYISPGTDVDSLYFSGDSGWTGTYTITVNPLSGTVDPVVAVYNASTGAQLGFDDNSGGGSSAQLSLSLDSATRYIVAVADAASTGTGNVEILIDAPGTGTYKTISLDAAGDGSSSDLLGATDTDFFRFTAPADTNGELALRVVPGVGTLDTAVALFDSGGILLAQSYSAGAGLEDVLTIAGLTPGAVYYASVLPRNYDRGTGGFNIYVDFDLIVPDEFPGQYDYWTIPDVYGRWSASFPLGAADDWDGWLFAHDVDSAAGAFTATGLGGVKPILGLYDVATGQRLAYDSNPTNSDTASINASLDRWTRYYIVASTKDGTTGTVQIGMDLAEATLIIVSIDDLGQGSASGLIDNPADIDYYRATAPVHANGQLTIELTNADPSLRAALSLWDNTAGTWMGSASAASAGANVTLNYSNVTASHVYDLAATSHTFVNGTGSFDLSFNYGVYDVPVTVPPLEYYGPVNLMGDRNITAEFYLNSVGDRDAWRFTTEDGGRTSFTATAAAGVNPLLALYNGDGDLVKVANDASGTTETLTYTLNGDEVYTILVQDAERDTAGDVNVTINSPSTTAPTVALNTAGVGTDTGTLGFGTDPAKVDPDYFQFTAPAGASGAMTLTVDPVQAFRAEFQLFDAAGNPVGSRYTSPSDGDPATHSYSSLNPGETYHVCVFPYRFEDHPAGGDFKLTVDFELRPSVDSLKASPAFIVIPDNVTLTAFGVSDADGNLDRVDFYRDSNGNETYDPGVDAYLGSDTSASGGWGWKGSTAGMPIGRNYFFAVAKDATGAASDPAAASTLISKYLGGDANMDDCVDGGDYTLWADNYNQPGGWPDGDFNFDGFVDGGDYTIWADNYGAEVGAAEALAAGGYDAGDTSAGAPAGMVALAALPRGRSPAEPASPLSGWAEAGARRRPRTPLAPELTGATVEVGPNRNRDQLHDKFGRSRESGLGLHARLGRKLPGLEAELNVLEDPDLTVLASAI